MRKFFRWWTFATTLVLGLSSPAALGGTVVKMSMNGTIHSGTVSMLEAAMAEAKAKKAEALFIEMDTPGGLLDATRKIVKIFLNADIPIIVFVGPAGARAGSAGTFITMAAHIAVMAPGTNIGAAHPITITGKDPEKDGGKHLAQKVENDTIAFIQTISKQRKRNAEWAKKAVKESASITEEEALKLKVIDLIARNPQSLLEKIDGRKVDLQGNEKILKTKNAVLISFEPDFETRTKNWLANPTIMFLLLMIAGLGLYVEFSHPGLIFPSVVAGIAIILLLIATSVIPITAVGLGLIALGFVLIFMELYVTSFGLLAAGGVVSFILGASMLFDPTEVDLRVPPVLIISIALAIGAMAAIVAVGISRMFKLRQTAGKEGLKGLEGKVEDAIAPENPGRIYINGEYWNATADETIGVGETIRVVGVTGLVAHVEKLTTPTEA